MTGYPKLSRVCPPRGVRLFAAPLLMISLWSAVGCSEHRISLAAFLEQQRRAVEQQQKELEPDVTFDLDAYFGPYKVGPGDVLTVLLTGRDGVPLFPPLPVRVDREGRIDLPVVGSLPVGDRQLAAVEDIILSAYVPNVYKGASCHVEQTAWETTHVLVTGAVTQPGLVELRRTDRNMLFAIVGAGGSSEVASGHATLRRLREPGKQITLNLREPLEIKAALALEPLQSGDILTVHAAQPNTIYVGGLVNRPGRQDYASGTEVSVLQAIAAANGLRTDVNPSEGALIRRLPDGKDVFVKLDLDRLATGRDPNFLLVAGDILWVPQTFGTRVHDFLNRNLFLRGGATVTYNLVGFETFTNNAGGFGGAGGTLQDTIDPIGFLGAPAPKLRR